LAWFEQLAAMQLFYDLRLGYLVETPGIETPIGDLSAKAGDIESLVLQFGRSEAADNSNSLYAAGTWTPVNLSGGSVIKLGIKEDGKYSDGEILAINAAWTQDTEAYLYLGELNLNTTAINSALARLDDDSDNDVSSLVCQLELTFQVGGVGGWRSSVRAVEIEIYHDIIGGAEGTPINADDPDQYLLKADAASTSNGYGASLIGIEDSGDNFTGGTVEDALAELAGAIGGGSGTVTSVAVTGSDGIEVDSGSPITTSGTIALGVNAGTLRSHINVADGANNYVHPNHSGDVTSAGDGATTIANGAVTFAKMADIATQKLIGRHSTGSGVPQQVGIGSSLEFSGANIERAALAGDVTASAGSNATTIANNAVTNAKAADMAANTIKGRITGSTGDPEDLSAANVRTIINVSDGADPTGATIHAATAKTTPVDADTIPLIDSAASNSLKKVSWLNVKATLKTYFDTLYNLYVLPVAGTTTIGGVKRNAGVTGEFIKGYDASGNAEFGVPVSGYRPNMNAIVNGGFRVAQRGESFTSIADAAYCFDRWYVLSDGNGVVDVGRNYSAGLGEVGLTVKTINKKFGIAQIIEGQEIQDLKKGVATLSFLARRSVGSSALGIKGVVLEWVGTEDAPTRDFVSSWNASGGDPTFVTNWAVVGTVTSSGTEGASNVSYKRTVNAASAPATNLAVFFYITNSAATSLGDQIIISDAQLEPGAEATTFQRVPIPEELARCQRYYEVDGYNSSGQAAVSATRGTAGIHYWQYKTKKRTEPVVSLVSGSWAGGTPTIIPTADMCYFTRAAGNFNASGTSGNVALAADAEL
jgi:hypothetical protein